jgi:4-hydroxy-tetrahydrodipicolinate synthase
MFEDRDSGADGAPGDAGTVVWHGILPSIPTPFSSSGECDPRGMREVIRFALQHGADGIVCFGLAGEVSRLTCSERKAMLEVCVDEVAGAVPLLAGATAENLLMSQSLARHAEECGADAVILPPPTGYRIGEADLCQFMVEVAATTSLPVIIQDAPEYLGVAIRPEVVLAAARSAPNIRAMKLETGPEGMERWRAALGDGFALYGGNGGMYLLDCLRAGALGIMPGIDTVDLQVEVARAERRGDTDKADELFARLLPLLVFEMQSIDHYNACAKHVLRMRGVEIEASLRAPGPRTLSARSVQRLESYLERLALPNGAGVRTALAERHG